MTTSKSDLNAIAGARTEAMEAARTQAAQSVPQKPTETFEVSGDEWDWLRPS